MAQTEDKAVEASEAARLSEARGGKSFSDVYGDFWKITTFFSAAVGHDKRLNPFIRTAIVYNLGIIAGVNEMLLEVDFFSSADAILNKSENVKHYIAIMAKLAALYEDYRAGGKVNASGLLEAIEDIESELFSFARKVMAQLR